MHQAELNMNAASEIKSENMQRLMNQVKKQLASALEELFKTGTPEECAEQFRQALQLEIERQYGQDVIVRTAAVKESVVEYEFTDRRGAPIFLHL